MRASVLPAIAFLFLLSGCDPVPIQTDDPGRDLDRPAIAAELLKVGVTPETASREQLIAASRVVYPGFTVVDARLVDDGDPATEDPIEVQFEAPGTAIPSVLAKTFLENLKDFSIPAAVMAAIPALAAAANALFAYIALKKGGVKVEGKPLLTSKQIAVASLTGGLAALNETKQLITDPTVLNYLGVLAGVLMAGLRVVTKEPMNGAVVKPEDVVLTPVVNKPE